MAKTKFLYGFLFPAFVCLYMLHAGRVLGQQPDPPGMDSFRQALVAVFRAEIGVAEATGNNDGDRVSQYLRYSHLPEGNEWCAALVSWCFGRLGRSAPRNPWSPALFPAARIIWRSGGPPNAKIQAGDVFGLWHQGRRRIAHVGFIDGRRGDWWLTVEGNVDNAVRSRRRHYRSIHCIADWVKE